MAGEYFRRQLILQAGLYRHGYQDKSGPGRWPTTWGMVKTETRWTLPKLLRTERDAAERDVTTRRVSGRAVPVRFADLAQGMMNLADIAGTIEIRLKRLRELPSHLPVKMSEFP
jgi:hypothetical protein